MSDTTRVLDGLINSDDIKAKLDSVLKESLIDQSRATTNIENLSEACDQLLEMLMQEALLRQQQASIVEELQDKISEQQIELSALRAFKQVTEESFLGGDKNEKTSALVNVNPNSENTVEVSG